MRNWLRSGALVLLCWAQGAVAGTVLVVGDSISAAFGLETEQGWVQLLRERIAESGKEHAVVNASVSGDTSAGGLSRLESLLAEHRPQVVIIELGGNDAGIVLPLRVRGVLAVVDADDALGDVEPAAVRLP